MTFTTYETSELKKLEEKALAELLSSCNSENIAEIKTENELCCRIMVFEGDKCIAHGAGYIRNMRIEEYDFIAGIIGGIAVDSNFRLRGIAKNIINQIHECFKKKGVHHSFLFASEPKVYFSNGYKMLENTMRVYDSYECKWQEFVWNDSMYADLCDKKLPSGLLEFNGCNY